MSVPLPEIISGFEKYNAYLGSYIDALKKARVVELDEEVKNLKAAHTASMERAAQLEKENTELRAKLCATAIAAAEAPAVNTIEEVAKKTMGLTSYNYTPPPGDLGEPSLIMHVMGSTSSEEALLNEGYINVGTAFEGYKYLRPAGDDNRTAPADACIRVRFDPTMATGHIRVPMYTRLAFGLQLGEAYEFNQVEQPSPVERCTVAITPITRGAPSIDMYSVNLRGALKGAVLFENCNLAIRHMSVYVYRITVKSTSPGVGIFGEDTRMEPAVETTERIV